MQDIKKEKYVVVLMGIIFATLLRIQQREEIHRIFIRADKAGQIKFSIIYIFAFFVSVAFFSLLIWGVFELGRWKRAEYTQFFSFFYLYLFIQSIFLLGMWPGSFRADEMRILANAVVNLNVFWSQSFFSFLLMSTSLIIVPYLAFITFFQLCIISSVAALIFVHVQKVIRHKKLAYLLFVPYLILPVLDNNLYVIRSSIICWLIFYMIVRCYTAYAKQKCFSKQCVIEALTIAVLVGAWKIEMFCFLPCFGGLFLWGNFKTLTKKKVLGTCGLVLGVIFVFMLPSFFEPESNYITTAVLTPVSDILVKHENNYPEEIKEDIEVLSKFIPVSEMTEKERKFGVNIPIIYWDKEVLDTDYRKAYMRSALRVFAYYPKDFIENRIKVYRYTNAFVPNVRNQNRSPSIREGGFDLLTDHFRYTLLGNTELRAKTICFLACRVVGDYSKTTWAFPILYNTTPYIVGLAVIFLFGIARKKVVHIFLTGSLLVHFIILFMLVPAFFFMYYMPLYLCGMGYLIMILIQYIDTKTKTKTDKTETDKGTVKNA